MIDLLVIGAIIGVAAFFYLKKKKQETGAPPAAVPTAPTPAPRQAAPQYVPDASTIKDQASWEEYRNSLSPSTRAFTREVAFGPDGKPLDAGGREIKPDAQSGPVSGVKVSAPGSVGLVYRGVPVTLAPVAGETDLNVGIHATFYDSNGVKIASQYVGADGTQVHLPLKSGDGFRVDLEAARPTVYWVKP